MSLSTTSSLQRHSLPLAGLHIHGAELIAEVDQYEDSYRLCCVRGPQGIIIALSEELNRSVHTTS